MRRTVDQIASAFNGLSSDPATPSHISRISARVIGVDQTPPCSPSNANCTRQFALTSKVLGTGTYGKVYLGKEIVKPSMTSTTPDRYGNNNNTNNITSTCSNNTSFVDTPSSPSGFFLPPPSCPMAPPPPPPAGSVAAGAGRGEARSYAIKVANKEAAYRRSALNESKVLQLLAGSKETVSWVATYEWDGHICIVTELLAKTLFEIMKERNFAPTKLDDVRLVGANVCRSLSALHSHGYMHCDVKPENIMLRSLADGASSSCLIDFGAVRSLTENAYYDIQSLWYRSPEVLENTPYTPKIDAWSTGCLLFELATGAPLFPGSSPADQLKKIKAMFGGGGGGRGSAAAIVRTELSIQTIDQRVLAIHKQSPASEHLINLLYCLLNPKAPHRLSCGDALAHPFLAPATPCTSAPLPPPLPPPLPLRQLATVRGGGVGVGVGVGVGEAQAFSPSASVSASGTALTGAGAFGATYNDLTPSNNSNSSSSSSSAHHQPHPPTASLPRGGGQTEGEPCAAPAVVGAGASGSPQKSSSGFGFGFVSSGTPTVTMANAQHQHHSHNYNHHSATTSGACVPSLSLSAGQQQLQGVPQQQLPPPTPTSTSTCTFGQWRDSSDQLPPPYGWASLDAMDNNNTSTNNNNTNNNNNYAHSGVLQLQQQQQHQQQQTIMGTCMNQFSGVANTSLNTIGTPFLGGAAAQMSPLNGVNYYPQQQQQLNASNINNFNNNNTFNSNNTFPSINNKSFELPTTILPPTICGGGPHFGSNYSINTINSNNNNNNNNINTSIAYTNSTNHLTASVGGSSLQMSFVVSLPPSPQHRYQQPATPHQTQNQFQSQTYANNNNNTNNNNNCNYNNYNQNGGFSSGAPPCFLPPSAAILDGATPNSSGPLGPSLDGIPFAYRQQQGYQLHHYDQPQQHFMSSQQKEGGPLPSPAANDNANAFLRSDTTSTDASVANNNNNNTNTNKTTTRYSSRSLKKSSHGSNNGGHHTCYGSSSSSYSNNNGGSGQSKRRGASGYPLFTAVPTMPTCIREGEAEGGAGGGGRRGEGRGETPPSSSSASSSSASQATNRKQPLSSGRGHRHSNANTDNTVNQQRPQQLVPLEPSDSSSSSCGHQPHNTHTHRCNGAYTHGGGGKRHNRDSGRRGCGYSNDSSGTTSSGPPSTASASMASSVGSALPPITGTCW